MDVIFYLYSMDKRSKNIKKNVDPHVKDIKKIINKINVDPHVKNTKKVVDKKQPERIKDEIPNDDDEPTLIQNDHEKLISSYLIEHELDEQDSTWNKQSSDDVIKKEPNIKQKLIL